MAVGRRFGRNLCADIAASLAAPHGAPADGAPLYPGTCRHLGAAEREGVTMRLTVIGCSDAFGSGGRFNTCFMVQGARSTILLDCGVMFPEDDVFGIDLVLKTLSQITLRK